MLQRLAPSWIFAIGLGLVAYGCAPAKPFIAPPNFTLKGVWEGNFTNAQGAIFPQTMVLEEEKNGRIRGRYVGSQGSENELSGQLSLPRVTFLLLGTEFTLSLVGEHEMGGWTDRAPGGGAAGRFHFTRKKQ